MRRTGKHKTKHVAGYKMQRCSMSGLTCDQKKKFRDYLLFVLKVVFASISRKWWNWKRKKKWIDCMFILSNAMRGWLASHSSCFYTPLKFVLAWWLCKCHCSFYVAYFLCNFSFSALFDKQPSQLEGKKKTTIFNQTSSSRTKAYGTPGRGLAGCAIAKGLVIYLKIK